jgi:hypothetical protein
VSFAHSALISMDFSPCRFDDLTWDHSQQQLPGDMFQGAAVTSNSTFRRTSWQKPVWQSSRTGQCLVISGKQAVCIDLLSAYQQRRHLLFRVPSAQELHTLLPPNGGLACNKYVASKADINAKPVQAAFGAAGSWQSNTAYRLTLSVSNPPPPNSLSPQNTKTPELWMVPLTFKTLEGTKQVPATGVQLIVRGSKYGQLCKLRYAKPSAVGLTVRTAVHCCKWTLPSG